MKKEKAEKSAEPVVREPDNAKLAKAIIDSLNGGEAKMAWNLDRDFDNPTTVTEFISTGSTLLDYVISNRRNGGVPVGKITELSGLEATGKSLVVSHLIAEVQRKGGIAVLIDPENAVNVDFMKQLGVDVSKLVYVQPPTVEDVGDTIEKIIIGIRTKAPDKLCLIAWDSVASTPCRAEVDGSYDANSTMGVKGKALSLMMRKLVQVWGKERIAMVVTNHLIYKIGVSYGDPLVTPGGVAIPFYSSVRIRLTKSNQIETEDKDAKKDDTRGKVEAIRTLAKCIKCRLGPPMRKCEFDIHFDRGIDDVGSWFTYLHEKAGEIEKNDGWCFLTSFKHPVEKRNRTVKKNDPEGKPCFAFRESLWAEEVAASPELKAHVLDLLEKHLVVKYDEKPKDQEIDPESLMDAEAVMEAVKEGAVS